ncbi:MAG: AAA family ATPase [bacterium]
MSNSKLIIICGLPGSGKSTISEALSRKLEIPVFSVDPIESSIIKSGIPKSFETGLAAYLVAETLAAANLQAGNSAIIDAVSGVIEAKQMWQALAKKLGVSLIIIECIVSNKNLHKTRIEERVRGIHGIPEVTWDDVDKREKEYIVWEEEKLILDAVNPLAENIKQVLQYIASRS